MGDKTLDTSFLDEISLRAKDASEEVKKFTLRLWHAGLGAVVKIELESSKLFGELVKEGEKVEVRLKKEVNEKTRALTLSPSEIFNFEAQLKKLEAAIEKSLNLILKRFGIPAKSDLEDLSKRIDSISKSVGLVAAKRAKT